MDFAEEKAEESAKNDSVKEPSQQSDSKPEENGRLQEYQRQERTSKETSSDRESLLSDNWHDKFANCQIFWDNPLPAVTYCATFFCFGMSVSFLGPTFLDLGCRTSTDLRGMSLAFFVQFLAMLIGCVLCAHVLARFLIPRFRLAAEMVLFVATAILPISMFLIPFCKVLTALAIVLAVMGLNMGCIDCLANLQMIQVYGEAVSPFLQAMHFCYGLGAFVSPMIAEPFLLNEDCTPFIDGITVNGSHFVAQNTTMSPAGTLHQAQRMTQVKYAFWIMAALQLPIPMLVFSLVMKMRFNNGKLLDDKTKPDGTDIGKSKSEYEDIDSGKESPTPRGRSLWQPSYTYHKNKWCGNSTSIVIAVTGLTSVLLFMYDGLQSAYGGYVYSYAVKSIVDLNKTEGAYLNACFWGTFALGRLLSIVVATRITPACMLLCNIVGCFFSMTLMLGLRHDHIALYIGTCLFGIFLSSVTPTALSLAEQYIDVTSSITAYLVVIAALGEMLFPVIVGNLFVELGPVSFLAFGDIVCFITILVFIVLWLVGRRSPKHRENGLSSFIWLHTWGQGRPSQQERHIEIRSVKFYSRLSESSSNLELNSVIQNGQMSYGNK